MPNREFGHSRRELAGLRHEAQATQLAFSRVPQCIGQAENSNGLRTSTGVSI